MKDYTKKLLGSMGYTIARQQKSTPAFDSCFLDQQRLLGLSRPLLILDIGAHHGETSLIYATLFPGSHIYAFEPFPASYQQLVNNTQHIPGLTAVNAAIGNTDGQVPFHCNSFSATSSLLKTDEGAAKYWGDGLLQTQAISTVSCFTLNTFLLSKGIDKIDILKIDTQGTEFEVLEGAANWLKTDKVTLVYLELILAKTYEQQKSMDEVFRLMRSFEFTFYNWYNPIKASNGRLIQMDALFVNERCLSI